MKKLLATLLILVLVMSLCPLAFAGSGYSVIVTDENGSPVEGAQIQLCTDSTCFVQTTGKDGRAEFADLEAGEYEVHVLKSPEGFEKNTVVQKTGKDGAPLSFVLKKTESYPVPEKSYSSLDEVNFKDYKLILVNYWEPWCHWCLAEMPEFEELWQEYRDRGLLIVGMYHDEDGAEKAIESTGITYPTIHYTENTGLTLYGVPVSVFYDSERNILPATAEDYVDMLMEEFKVSIEAYNYGAFDGIDDEEVREYLAVLNELMDDEEKLHDVCLEYAEAYAAESETFPGYSNIESWKTRIENRLA